MIIIEKEKCIGCGKCVRDCVGEVLQLKDNKAEYLGRCIQCGHCVAVCPTAAVSIPEYDMDDVEECRMEEVRPDIDQLLRTIKCRRSIRFFKEKKVEHEKLEKLIQAGRYTGTGVNRQGCRFVVVQEQLEELKDLVWSGIGRLNTSPEKGEAGRGERALKRFLEMKEQKGTDFLFRNAPVVLYIAAESTVDAALAAQNIEMAAIAQGMGALYNGYLVFDAGLDEEVGKWLGTACAQAPKKPVAVCMLLGYPDVEYQRTAPRKQADVRWK